MQPLKGTKVLDLTILSGYCGMELADYGAEVIKIETPNTGDPLRGLIPLKNEVSPHHIFRDRGKKSITLNLWTPEGQDIFKKLVMTADIVLENFPIGTLKKIGLDYEDMKKLKPSIIYGRITAYGSTVTNVPQSELVAQAKSGGMYVTGFPENPPTRIGFSIAQRYTASYLSSGICMALYHMRNTGEGQLVETSLCGSVAGITEDKVLIYGATKTDPMRTGNAHSSINPYDILKCRNGYVAMGISSNEQWMKFCDAFGRPEWKTFEKYASNSTRGQYYFGDLRVKLEKLFAEYNMEDIARICDSVLIPGTMCSTTKEALQQPQLHERNMIISMNNTYTATLTMPGRPIKFVGESESPIQEAPSLGEHNTEIYNFFGIDTKQLEQLKLNGII